ncbi:MAG TPA: GNAT family acetyltransferase [Phycisphaerales bacterium]|nr:GNAT family acetyltransferase [Phycisphaerales bacterium]
MMNTDPIKIVEFDNLKHRKQVVELWQDVFGYEAGHNQPEVAIDKKIAAGDGLFFVAVKQETVAGTVMAGYDGHRGWIYSIAVRLALQKKGIGSTLLAFAEEKLSSLGCMKINLQIMDGNDAVQQFYKANGYLTEKRISMGKRLNENIEGA